MYTAYVLSQHSRHMLLKKFQPKYSRLIAHHTTVKFGVPKDAVAPDPANLVVVGYVDSGDGIEALVVSVNGETRREDGSVYHITWSLDPTAYKPVDTNKYLKEYGFTLIDDVPIETFPTVLK